MTDVEKEANEFATTSGELKANVEATTGALAALRKGLGASLLQTEAGQTLRNINGLRHRAQHTIHYADLSPTFAHGVDQSSGLLHLARHSFVVNGASRCRCGAIHPADLRPNVAHWHVLDHRHNVLRLQQREWETWLVERCRVCVLQFLCAVGRHLQRMVHFLPHADDDAGDVAARTALCEFVACRSHPTASEAANGGVQEAPLGCCAKLVVSH